MTILKKLEKKMNGFDYFNHEHIEHAFIEGIEWADNNPKSSWISVEDDLPCNNKELISGEDPETIKITLGEINKAIDAYNQSIKNMTTK